MNALILPHTPYLDTPDFDELTDMLAACQRMNQPAATAPRKSGNAGYFWPDSIQTDVYRYIVTHPGCGRAEIAEDLHIHKATVGTCTSRLQAQGRITTVITGAMRRASYTATGKE